MTAKKAPKAVFVVYAVMRDGRQAAVAAYASEADADRHVASCLRVPMDSDGNFSGYSAAEILNLAGIVVQRLEVRSS